MDQLVNLIERYQADAARLSSKVALHFKVDNLFCAWREGAIPSQGAVEGISFKFHGSGCYFQTDILRVDVDFGPGGRVDGFDAGRLSRYVTENQVDSSFGFLEFQNALEALLAIGVIAKPGTPPSSHLFYFRQSA
jgi:hypothetical protein